MISFQRKAELLEELLWKNQVNHMLDESTLQNMSADNDISKAARIGLQKLGIQCTEQELQIVILPLFMRIIESLKINDDIISSFKYRRIIVQDFMPDNPRPTEKIRMITSQGASDEALKRLAKVKHPDFPED